MIELWVANSRSIMERVAPILTVIRGTVGADPDLAAQWHVNEQQRRTACGALAQILADRGVLKTGLTRQDAADLAFLIDSVEGYFLATATLGWPPGPRLPTTHRPPATGQLIGYIRVSTDHQTHDAQRDALETLGVSRDLRGQDVRRP